LNSDRRSNAANKLVGQRPRRYGSNDGAPGIPTNAPVWRSGPEAKTTPLLRAFDDTLACRRRKTPPGATEAGSVVPTNPSEAQVGTTSQLRSDGRRPMPLRSAALVAPAWPLMPAVSLIQSIPLVLPLWCLAVSVSIARTFKFTAAPDFESRSASRKTLIRSSEAVPTL
jgi:hypothetical protein